MILAAQPPGARGDGAEAALPPFPEPRKPQCTCYIRITCDPLQSFISDAHRALEAVGLLKGGADGDDDGLLVPRGMMKDKAEVGAGPLDDGRPNRRTSKPSYRRTAHLCWRHACTQHAQLSHRLTLCTRMKLRLCCCFALRNMLPVGGAGTCATGTLATRAHGADVDALAPDDRPIPPCPSSGPPLEQRWRREPAAQPPPGR